MGQVINIHHMSHLFRLPSRSRARRVHGVRMWCPNKWKQNKIAYIVNSGSDRVLEPHTKHRQVCPIARQTFCVCTECARHNFLSLANTDDAEWRRKRWKFGEDKKKKSECFEYIGRRCARTRSRTMTVHEIHVISLLFTIRFVFDNIGYEKLWIEELDQRWRNRKWRVNKQFNVRTMEEGSLVHSAGHLYHTHTGISALNTPLCVMIYSCMTSSVVRQQRCRLVDPSKKNKNISFRSFCLSFSRLNFDICSIVIACTAYEHLTSWQWVSSHGIAAVDKPLKQKI